VAFQNVKSSGVLPELDEIPERYGMRRRIACGSRAPRHGKP